MFTAIQKSRAKKGFTLVELIVVISIIAILMLILVPSLLAYLNKSKKTKAEANAKTAYNAVVSVFTDLYAKGEVIDDGDDLIDAAEDEDMLKRDSKNVYTCVITDGKIDYVTWAAGSSYDSDDYDDGNWARWPAASTGTSTTDTE